MAILPLFPLATALMPGAFLPLQIFEPRYVSMLKDLVAGQEERDPVFGVIAIRRGHEVGERTLRDHGMRALHSVGCAAQIVQAADLGSGRYLVVSQGRARFKLHALHDAEQPYPQGKITWLPEVDGVQDQQEHQAMRLRTQLAGYQVDLGLDEPEIPDDDRELSYLLPQVLDLDLNERQHLLMSATTLTRLRLASHILRREHALTEALGTLGRPDLGPISSN